MNVACCFQSSNGFPQVASPLTLERTRATARMAAASPPTTFPSDSLSSRWLLTVDEDSQLIERTLSGDRSAFNELVMRYQDRLYSSMLAVTGCAEEAEDVVQDAFVRAFVKLESFQQSSQFFTWLYRIAFNTALSRHRKRRSKISLDQTREATGLEPIDLADAPDEPMMRRERVEMVRLRWPSFRKSIARSWCFAKWTTIPTKRLLRSLKFRLARSGVV
jgi:DNA-directed RNA polymerase specialized sigma24 family protein